MFTSLRNQLAALIVAAILLVLFVAGVGYFAARQVYGAVEVATESATHMRNQMNADMQHEGLKANVALALRTARNSNKDPQQMAAALKDAKTVAAEMKDSFYKNKTVATLKADVEAITPTLEKYTALGVKITDDAARDVEAAEAQMPEFLATFSALEAVLEKLSKKIETDVQETEKAAEATLGSSEKQIAIVVAIAVFVLLWAAILMYRRVAGSLTTLQNVITSVNAGDLTARSKLLANDELGVLGRSFDGLLDERITALDKAGKENETLNNSVITLLQTVFQLSNRDLTARAPVTEDIIGTVSSSINQLSDETGRTLAEVQHIAEQVRATSEAVRVQSVMVEETARSEREALQSMSTNLNQATDQLAQMATLSSQSNTAAEQAATATQAALTAVDGTVKGMDQLRDSISDMEKRFKRLGERSQEISTAVQLINTISERTHVLALNASMQAATAGEAGRGFAVVAEEVQRLSDSSRQATSTISQLVGNIQAETNETLFTVNRLIGEVVKQSELAQRAGLQMNQTQSTTTQLVGLVRQIAAFSEQQAKLAGSLQQSVLDINHGTEQTSTAIAEQTASTQTLADFSRRLTQAVGQFKLPAQTA